MNTVGPLWPPNSGAGTSGRGHAATEWRFFKASLSARVVGHDVSPGGSQAPFSYFSTPVGINENYQNGDTENANTRFAIFWFSQKTKIHSKSKLGEFS
jgi:hypothetical protein